MPDPATLQTRLTEAQAALHALRTGTQVVEVRTETETVKYAAADVAGLQAYIAELTAALNTRRRRAIGVSFR